MSVHRPTALESLFTVHQIDGRNVYNMLTTVYVSPDINPVYFSEHAVTQQDSWTTISHRYYKTADHWWIVAICNRDLIDNPVEMPSPGTLIRIPNEQLLRKIIGAVQ